MINEETFLAAIREDPSEPTVWLALADWLEEQGDPRGELLRLTRLLQHPGGAERPMQEERLCRLLAQGVRPCWPTLTNSIGMKLALIPAGTFLMGSPEDEEGREAVEGPRHEVTIRRPFWLGIYPVTQEQYQRVMGDNPRFRSQRRGPNCPTDSRSWYEARIFCQKLSQIPEERRRGRVYRLPTEAEWEYACRGGASSSTAFSFGNALHSTQANFNRRRTSAVGSYPANAFGLYDMHGNVWEWCADWFGSYPHGAVTEPTGPPEGTGRVARGGCWHSPALCCRSAVRLWCEPACRPYDLGFRVACGFSSEVE